MTQTFAAIKPHNILMENTGSEERCAENNRCIAPSKHKQNNEERLS